MTSTLYAADGVNVAEEASFSHYAGEVCKVSYANSAFVEVHDLAEGGFRGPRPVTFKNLPDGFLVEASADGIGTKGSLIDAAGMHETAGYDLVAMVASDITRYGGVPLILINILDTVSIGVAGDSVSETYKKLIRGLGQAAREVRAVALKGETTQMNVCISADNADSPTKFNWGATMLGAYHPDKMVTGKTLAPGQKVIALKERGFRCNGISAVRKALKLRFGEQWWANPEAQEAVKAAAAPSVLYDAFINTLHGWYAPGWKPEITLHAVAHLSGGGIKEKFANDIVLKQGLSADLDALFEPPDIMKKCASWRGIEDAEFYETWNGGQGMLLVVDERGAEACVERAGDFGIEARVCGEIIKKQSPAVTLRSMLSGATVRYE